MSNKPHSNRAKKIKPFHVMALLAQAQQLASQGKKIYHLEVGEPDFATADNVIQAGIKALNTNKTKYTPALGLTRLREAIAKYYQQKFAIKINPARIIVTPGASGALQLAMACILNAGEEVLITDPGYPCNRNIAQLLMAKVKSIVVDDATNFQLTPALIKQHWGDKTRMAIVATPANPTGSILTKLQLKLLYEAVEQKNGCLIVDEIYQGLVYDSKDFTALEITDECFVINSFSKYFSMTGWRIGWMVVPEMYIESIEKIAQNIFLSTSTIAQYAAIEALKPNTQLLLNQQRDIFKLRRDFLYRELTKLGFVISAKPDGAFYLYANCEKFCDDSFLWVRQLLANTGVALAPGIDFGEQHANKYCRFAYVLPQQELEQALAKIAAFI